MLSLDLTPLYSLELDLSVLAAPRSLYIRYATACREEFRHVSDALYIEGRTSFLKKTNAYPLFRTKYFQQHFEAQAKANISWEIKRWLQ